MSARPTEEFRSGSHGVNAVAREAGVDKAGFCLVIAENNTCLNPFNAGRLYRRRPRTA
jgi:hypothetical protein